MNEEIEHLNNFKRRTSKMCMRLRTQLDKDSFAVGMQSLEVILISHLIRDGHDKEEYMQYFSEAWDEYERIDYQLEVDDILEKIQQIEKKLGLK